MLTMLIRTSLSRSPLSRRPVALAWRPLSALLVVSIWLVAPTARASWPHFGYDNVYTSCNPVETSIDVTSVKTLKKAWGINCNTSSFAVIFRTPAIGGGKLFTARAGGKLGAFDALSGKSLWTFGTANNAWATQPTVTSGGRVLYLEGTSIKELYAVDATTGAQQWKTPVGFNFGFSEASEALITVDETNKVVYLVENSFMPGGGRLYAIDETSGNVLWYKSKPLDGIDFGGNYVLLDAGKLYAQTTKATPPNNWDRDFILRINATTKAHELFYNRPTTNNVRISGHTLCDTMLVVAYSDFWSSDSWVAANATGAAAVTWYKHYATSKITGKIACDPSKKIVYVPTDPVLYAYDAVTGAQKWKHTGFAAIHSPSIANGVVYFLSGTNMVAVDQASGKTLFTFPLGYTADKTTQVAINDGRLYFSGNGGTCDLFALGLAADLQLQSFAASVSGSQVTYTVTVCNKGKGGAGKHEVGVFYNRGAAPAAACSDPPDVTVAIPALAPQQCATKSTTRTGAAPGSYIGWALADAKCAVAESDEGNNTASAAYSVAAAPDLGTPDSKAPDAGAPDAFVDAASVDSGGGSDVLVPDVSSPDIGSSADSTRDVGQKTDISPTSDAGPRDAGVDVGTAAGADAGTGNKTAAGCSCRYDATAGGDAAGVLLLVLGLLVVRRCRRRRRVDAVEAGIGRRPL